MKGQNTLFRLSVLLLFVFPLTGMAQQSDTRVAGRFRDFYNQQNADSLFSLFSPIMKQAATLDKTRQLITNLHAQAGEFNSVDLIRREGENGSRSLYKSVFTNLTMTMILVLNQDGLIDGLHFTAYEASPKPAASSQPSNFTLQTETGNIYGTLDRPDRAGKVPIVLIIAGSGPTDRDCNAAAMSLHTDAYKQLADSLRQHGIASLRYDKRGVGESAGAMRSEAELRLETYIIDARQIIQQLKADDRFSKVIVLGHSEGSLIGMIAAREGKADAFISLAGAGEGIDKVLTRQLSDQSPAAATKARKMLDSLQKGQRVAEPVGDALLMPFFNAGIQPYMQSWVKYDPPAEIKKLSTPVLILQGTNDLQVRTEDARLLKKALPTADLHLITGMNHVLKNAGEDRSSNLASYGNPALPLDQELVLSVLAFIISH